MSKRVLTVVALVAALGCAGCDDRPAAQPGPRPAPTTTAPVTATAGPAPDRTTADNRAWGRRQIDRAVDSWPVPHGARAATPSQLHWLGKQRWGVEIGAPTARRSRLLLVPGEAADVLRWMRLHPAPGWGTGRRWGQLPYNSGSYSIGAASQGKVLHRYFGPRRVPTPRAYRNVTVQTMQLGDEVALRIDGVAVPAPVRSASSFVHHVTSVRFHQWRQTRNRWRLVEAKTLRGPVVARLARQVNRAQGWTGTQHSCPFYFWPHYRLLFHTPRGDLRADNFGGCLGLWTLHANGERLKPELSTGYRLDRIVRRIGVITRGM